MVPLNQLPVACGFCKLPNQRITSEAFPALALLSALARNKY
jgi:hypothetical protein